MKPPDPKPRKKKRKSRKQRDREIHESKKQANSDKKGDDKETRGKTFSVSRSLVCAGSVCVCVFVYAVILVSFVFLCPSVDLIACLFSQLLDVLLCTCGCRFWFYTAHTSVFKFHVCVIGTMKK